MPSICSTLKHLLEEVIHTQMGISAQPIELVEATTGKPSRERKGNTAVSDRFKIKVPISDQYLTWEVIFNCSYPEYPPDFGLNDVEFFYSLTVDSLEESLPSLMDWDHSKDKALINVLSELRSAYLKYQVERLHAVDMRCAYMYDALINGSIPADQQVEVYIEGNIIHFLIRLQVNLPTQLSAESEDHLVLLSVKYGAMSIGTSSNLISSSDFNQLIGFTPDLPRKIKCDDSLAEYTEEVTRAIEEQMCVAFSKREKKRKEFVFEMLRKIGKSVISYDALNYYKISFFMELNDGYMCIVEISLHTNFPGHFSPPQCRLLSIYNRGQNGNPISQNFKLPFIEIWPASTLVEQALLVLKDKKIPLFRDVATRAFQLPE